MIHDEEKNKGLIPSPLIAGVFPIPKDPSIKDIEEICAKYGANSGLLILFREHDALCSEKKGECGGLHSVGQDYKIDHIKAHIVVRMVEEVYGLDKCGEE